MNFRYVLKSLGSLMYIEAAFMVLPFIVALIYGEYEEVYTFILTIGIIYLIGRVFRVSESSSNEVLVRDGFATVGLGWIIISILGALPFIISGTITSVPDAIFESVSGFTTTGSTIISDLDKVPYSLIFWRSLMNWLGGVGVLFLMVALIPTIKGSSLHILKAETPGPTTEKFVPKIKQVTKILFIIYFMLTFIEFVLLLFGGMSIFDSMIHSFSTAGLGGFSSKNTSIAFFDSVYIETIIGIFMFIFGVNFSLYGYAFKGNFKTVFKDEELRLYILMNLVGVLLIMFNLKQSMFPNIFEAFRYTAFNFISTSTSTGFSTFDFNTWPIFSHIILLFVMFVGASAGSSSGGFTVIRMLLLYRIVKRSLLKLMHPSSLQVVKINGKAISEELISNVMIFFFLYISIIFMGTLLVSIDTKDLITSFSSVLTAISNNGPGLGDVGPASNFSGLSDFTKIILSICMLIGRLEIYPILLILTPVFWKK